MRNILSSWRGYNLNDGDDGELVMAMVDGEVGRGADDDDDDESSPLFFITLKSRVKRYTKYISLRYAPASEPLNISVKKLFSN